MLTKHTTLWYYSKSKRSHKNEHTTIETTLIKI